MGDNAVPGATTGPWKSEPGQPTGRSRAPSRWPGRSAHTAPATSRTTTTDTDRPLACTAAAKPGWKYGLSSAGLPARNDCQASISAPVRASNETSRAPAVRGRGVMGFRVKSLAPGIEAMAAAGP